MGLTPEYEITHQNHGTDTPKMVGEYHVNCSGIDRKDTGCREYGLTVYIIGKKQVKGLPTLLGEPVHMAKFALVVLNLPAFLPSLAASLRCPRCRRS